LTLANPKAGYKPALRFMGSFVFLSDLLTGYEPEGRKCLQISGTTFRFMERCRDA